MIRGLRIMIESEFNCLTDASQELGNKRHHGLTNEEIKKLYAEGNYETYFIEFSGDIVAAFSKIDFGGVYVTDKFFAILVVKKGMLNTLVEMVPEITNVQPSALYCLSDLSIDNNINKEFMFYDHNIPLNGEGVIVGIIGAGIDYLNPRFTDTLGESRIINIWDQTIEKGPIPKFFPYGTEYSKEDITNAIKAKAIGGSPYEVVAHKDENGHGTAIAGIIGGRNLGNDDKFKSIAPNCEFAIVKLAKAQKTTFEVAHMEEPIENVYETISVASAIRYLSDLQEKLKKPMVVYLPLGTNFGGRDGITLLERYIDNLTQRRTFSIVTNTGNQGSGRTHASGLIRATGGIEHIPIKVDSEQKSLIVSVYTRRPDIINIGITNPQGNSIKRIPKPTAKEKNKFLTLEENNISIEYLIGETSTGFNSVNMLIKNTTEGIWNVDLYGEGIASGLYDAWLPQSNLLKGDTRFLSPNPNTTLLTPCSAMNVISTSYYNQFTNEIAEDSGRGFPRNGKIEPVVTIGGVNLLTVGINNSLVLGTGETMAGAILAGAIALIYEWGIVEGNLPHLYASRLKTILISSTIKDNKKIYPNEAWGFGKLDFKTLFEVLLRSSTKNKNCNCDCNDRDKALQCLYINIPQEIYKNIRKNDFK